MTMLRMRNQETTSKLPLTARQREALEFIRRCVRKRGYGPTVREIGDQMGINSPNGVVGHLVALERKGFIHREANLSRSIMLVERGEKTTTGLRVLANIEEGKIIDNPNPEERLDLAERIQLAGEDWFLLRVRDNLLVKHAILEGDLLLIRKARTAADGEHVLLKGNNDELIPAKCVFNPVSGKTVLQTLEEPARELDNSCSGIYGALVAVIRIPFGS